MGMRNKSGLFWTFLFLLFISIIAMAEAKPDHTSSSDSAVQIVYVERPENEEAEAFHIRTLASVLGSEEAAKEALIYSYKNAASGFSAKLTPEQVSQISKQPGVLQVVPSRTVQLHSGTRAAAFRNREAALKDVKLLYLVIYIFQTVISCVNQLSYVLCCA